MSPTYGWGISLVSMLALTTYLGHTLAAGDRRVFLPGDTTAGHHQIEERCELCHTRAFGDAEALQDACVSCHGVELREVDDSHPRAKFTDPRNADRVARLDARYCATCHREHVPRATGGAGLTLPRDYCFHCHEDVGEERATHAALPFDGCADSGCHNFHDNRALYEDFLVKHADAPRVLAEPTLPAPTPAAAHAAPLAVSQVDAPGEPLWRPSSAEVARWAASSHARAGVNCSDCHAREDGSWAVSVPPAACGTCHAAERSGFETGRHGMRWAAELSPMRPALARLPMRAEASQRPLDCATCHGAHDFDPTRAATSGCLECHADRHSLAFEDSPHAGWSDGSEARITCATCHLPRITRISGEVHVEHDQNANLRPRDKMARDVCMHCHGLRFTLDSLADAELVQRNFDGPPSTHHPSVDWALRRIVSETPTLKEGPP